jgi:hypothetical protein
VFDLEQERLTRYKLKLPLDEINEEIKENTKAPLKKLRNDRSMRKTIGVVDGNI